MKNGSLPKIYLLRTVDEYSRKRQSFLRLLRQESKKGPENLECQARKVTSFEKRNSQTTRKLVDSTRKEASHGRCSSPLRFELISVDYKRLTIAVLKYSVLEKPL